MAISERESHARAVAFIQALLSKHLPGSSPYRVAERALDLAFNGPRASGAALELTLLRQAEAVIKLQVRAKLISELDADSISESPPSSRAPNATRGVARRGTPRSRAYARFVQMEHLLLGVPSKEDSHGLIC